MAQVTEHCIWKIVELFYKSFLAFRDIYDQYESRIAAHIDALKVPRETLQLSHLDLAGLIEFPRLEDLRNRYLLALKDGCHEIFRDRDHTDLLDRYVSTIFHEISILKEEHYTVKHYAPYWARAEAQRELASIMEEAGTLLPRKMQHLDFLFKTARERLEKLLPDFRGQKILVRSLFLNRHGFAAACYPSGIEGFYTLMYPENGPLEGYVEAGESFFKGAFYAQACEAFSGALDCARRGASSAPDGASMIDRLSSRLRESGEALRARQEIEKDLRG